MPDVHGARVRLMGSVFRTKDAIIPCGGGCGYQLRHECGCDCHSKAHHCPIIWLKSVQRLKSLVGFNQHKPLRWNDDLDPLAKRLKRITDKACSKMSRTLGRLGQSSSVRWAVVIIYWAIDRNYDVLRCCISGQSRHWQLYWWAFCTLAKRNSLKPLWACTRGEARGQGG